MVALNALKPTEPKLVMLFGPPNVENASPRMMSLAPLFAMNEAIPWMLMSVLAESEMSPPVKRSRFPAVPPWLAMLTSESVRVSPLLNVKVTSSKSMPNKLRSRTLPAKSIVRLPDEKLVPIKLFSAKSVKPDPIKEKFRASIKPSVVWVSNWLTPAVVSNTKFVEITRWWSVMPSAFKRKLPIVPAPVFPTPVALNESPFKSV